MVDPKKELEAETGPENDNVKDMDDKSINELLKEYAEDVKDKDLDEFLSDSNDDQFDDSDADDTAPVAAAPKKSGGFLSFLLFLIVVGAAGAGAWIYLNKDQGMTNVMGGFGGDTTATLDTPPLPDTTPSMPGAEPVAAAPATTDTAESPIASPFPANPEMATDVPAPTPIVNEAAPAMDTAATSEAPAADAATATAPSFDLQDSMPEAIVAAPADTAASTPTPAPAAEVAAPAAPSAEADSTASQAVDNWVSSATDGMAETEAKLGAAPTAGPTPEAVPEATSAPVAITPEAATPAVDVAEVNAKPVDAKANASAPKKAAAERSPYDDALPPPYKSIQAGKGASVDTTATASASTSSSAKMAPVVDGAAAEPTYKRGSTASTEPAETRATGVYKDLVKQGGGAIDLPGLTANVKNDITIGQEQQPARQIANPAISMPVDNGPVQLAIQGGKSLPPEMTAQTSTGSVTAKLPQALAEDPVVPAVPVEAVETETKASAPVATSSSSEAAPVATRPADSLSSNSSVAPTAPSPELRGIIQQAIAAEKSGDKEGAVALYQKALEFDAVEGDGTLDRGMVYDRIGALRAQ
ncbi:MAG TPA: hypothetical protein VIN59_07600 [Alphaproteobacteria bacterium]